ncbi:hypothetical protein MTO96_007585 [Rhipicephalus appendiculatus]
MAAEKFALALSRRQLISEECVLKRREGGIGIRRKWDAAIGSSRIPSPEAALSHVGDAEKERALRIDVSLRRSKATERSGFFSQGGTMPHFVHFEVAF